MQVPPTKVTEAFSYILKNYIKALSPAKEKYFKTPAKKKKTRKKSSVHHGLLRETIPKAKPQVAAAMGNPTASSRAHIYFRVGGTGFRLCSLLVPELIRIKKAKVSVDG
jgi:hypothetical protein